MHIAYGVLNQKECCQHGGRKFKNSPHENKLEVDVLNEGDNSGREGAIH
jgi:hypothetical protein